jgi:hypothetical protein
MRRRRLLLCVGVVACLGLAVGGFVWLTLPPPGVTRENYERIREGMSQADVEAVLGVPPGAYGRGGIAEIASSNSILVFDPSWRTECWAGDTISIQVSFDTDGRVAWKSYSVILREQETFWERLRRLLPW